MLPVGAGGAGPGGELPPLWRDLLAARAALGDGGAYREGKGQPGFADVELAVLRKAISTCR